MLIFQNNKILKNEHEDEIEYIFSIVLSATFDDDKTTPMSLKYYLILTNYVDQLI